MEDLPSAVHGKENVLYMAAQTLRNLATGTAFINFVDASGMKAALLAVPEVRSYAPPRHEFERLRERFLAASPSALPSLEARANVAHRKTALIAAAERIALVGEVRVEVRTAVALELPAPEEPEAPKAFRVKKRREPKGKR